MGQSSGQRHPPAGGVGVGGGVALLHRHVLDHVQRLEPAVLDGAGEAHHPLGIADDAGAVRRKDAVEHGAGAAQLPVGGFWPVTVVNTMRAMLRRVSSVRMPQNSKP